MARRVGRIVGIAVLAAALTFHGGGTQAARVVTDGSDDEQSGGAFGPGRLGVPAFVGEDSEPTEVPMPADPAAPADEPGSGPAPEEPAAPAATTPSAPGGSEEGAREDGTPQEPPGEPPAGSDAAPPETAPAAPAEAEPPAPAENRPPNLFGPGGPAEGRPVLEPGKELPGPASTAPLPDIHYGDADLPEPVRKTRAAILEAARSGDIEALRPVLEMNETSPTLSKEETGDPIAYLKGISGDLEGREILAILIDLLESGWVRINPGTPQEMYIWPYFAEVPVDRLTPAQLVELYRILTSADVDELRAYDAWLFFRIGIGPDGTWHFFMINEE